MKLKTALDIAKDCGLYTVGEALLNIEIYALSIFNYNTLEDEVKELHGEVNQLKLKEEDSLDIAYEQLNTNNI
ncbi:hypothetical protein [Clostridium thermobutyricum]|uniref:hypothetical protein n=1 Tax=Clostridium thermobutyricum TaxID=29372 RepID=UPI0018A97F63|nr:hypothetical protein [Clostridium thermobutyricum]